MENPNLVPPPFCCWVQFLLSLRIIFWSQSCRRHNTQRWDEEEARKQHKPGQIFFGAAEHRARHQRNNNCVLYCLFGPLFCLLGRYCDAFFSNSINIDPKLKLTSLLHTHFFSFPCRSPCTIVPLLGNPWRFVNNTALPRFVFLIVMLAAEIVAKDYFANPILTLLCTCQLPFLQANPCLRLTVWSNCCNMLDKYDFWCVQNVCQSGGTIIKLNAG